MPMFIWFIIVALVGIGVGYGFRGWINRRLHQAKDKLPII